MLKPICVKCSKELGEFGAILLSPPNSEGLISKSHVCIECYYNFLNIPYKVPPTTT